MSETKKKNAATTNTTSGFAQAQQSGTLGGGSSEVPTQPVAGTPSSQTGGAESPTVQHAYLPSSYQRYTNTEIAFGPQPAFGNRSTTGGDLGGPGSAPPGKTMTLQEAMDRLIVMGSQDQGWTQDLQARLMKAGFLNPRSTGFTPGAIASGDATYSAYLRLLATAIQSGRSVYDILKTRINSPDNTTGQQYFREFQALSGQVPTTTTNTSTSTDLTSAPDARAVAQSEYESLLGRNVTDREAAAFHAALNAYEQANPSVTTSTTTTDPSNPGHTQDTSSSTNQGGVGQGGAAELADSQIIQNHGKEYVQSQADQIYDLFASLIGG